MDELKSNQLVVLTGAGVISGNPVEKGTIDETSPKTFVSALTQMTFEQYKSDYSIDSSLPGNDGFFALKDAVLRTGSNTTYNIGEVIIFFDEIIGVSIGTLG